MLLDLSTSVETPADGKATVRDIEDIVVLGKESNVCPYYATRRAVKQSQVNRTISLVRWRSI